MESRASSEETNDISEEPPAEVISPGSEMSLAAYPAYNAYYVKLGEVP